MLPGIAGREAALQAERSLLDDPTKDQEKLEAVNIFFTNQTLYSALTMIQRKKHFTLEDHTIVSSYLFCSLVYRNWQWPGAAINLTTDEAAGAVERMATSLSTAGSIRQYLPMASFDGTTPRWCCHLPALQGHYEATECCCWLISRRQQHLSSQLAQQAVD